jgi:hypothetical protein
MSSKIGNNVLGGKNGNNILDNKLRSKVHLANLKAQRFTKENHYLLKLLCPDHGLCDNKGNVICFYVDYANQAKMVAQEFSKKNQHLLNLLERDHELHGIDGNKLLFYVDSEW